VGATDAEEGLTCIELDADKEEVKIVWEVLKGGL
jgi:hypothetical protein